EFNAITDVTGVQVGMTTLVDGPHIRTGVTAICPRGKDSTDPVFAGWFALNGNGEMTGTAWIDESGLLAGPVMITNTHSVGVAHEFKGGTGTASRMVDDFTVGVLVQANYGSRAELTIAGVPVGREISDLMPSEGIKPDTGSIIVVVATDAPLLPHQLRRVAKR